MAARRELCSHDPATLLEECNEIDGGVSTSVRAETPIPRQGKALVQLTFKHTLRPSSPIYSWLSACVLLDLHVGEDDLVCDKDYKHTAAKWVRNALLREKGIVTLSPSVCLT